MHLQGKECFQERPIVPENRVFFFLNPIGNSYLAGLGRSTFSKKLIHPASFCDGSFETCSASETLVNKTAGKISTIFTRREIKMNDANFIST